MSKPRRRYTEEFKKEAVSLSYNSDKTVKEVADDLGINRTMLTRWRLELKRLNSRAFSRHMLQKLTPEEEEIFQLKRELAIVTEERDILKKAVGIFSKNLNDLLVYPGTHR